MASAGGGAAGEGEWLKIAELRAAVQAQDPGAKVRDDEPLYFTAPASSSIDLFVCLLAFAAFSSQPRLAGAHHSRVSTSLACLTHVNYILDPELPSLLVTVYCFA